MVMCCKWKESHTPAVGDYLQPDGWNFGENLEESNGYSDNSFPGCQFRLPAGGLDNNGDPMYLLAVNLTVVGKPWTLSYTNRYRSRVKIEFVGDGEPSTFHKGWIYHD